MEFYRKVTSKQYSYGKGLPNLSVYEEQARTMKQEREAQAKDFIENVASVDVELNAKYIDEIKILFATASDEKKTKVRDIMSSNGLAKFDAETNKTSVLSDILAVLKA